MLRSAVSVLRLIQALVGSCVCLLGIAVWAADGPGKVGFALPAGPLVVSNLNRLEANQSIFERSRDDLFKPLESALPQNSLEPVLPPMNFFHGPAVPDAKTQQRQDEQKNWLFHGLSDLNNKDIDLEKAYGLSPDGLTDRNKPFRSAIETYSLDKDKKRSTPGRPGLGDFDGMDRKPDYYGTNAGYPRDFSYSFAGMDQATGGVSGAESSSAPVAGSPRPDFLMKKDERTLQRDAEWLKTLDGPSGSSLRGDFGRNSQPGAPGSLAPLNGIDGSLRGTMDSSGNWGMSPATLGVGPAGGAAMAPSVYRNPANPQAGSTMQTPGFSRPSMLADPTFRALGMPQPAGGAQLEPAKKTPTAYQFESQLPKRNF